MQIQNFHRSNARKRSSETEAENSLSTLAFLRQVNSCTLAKKTRASASPFSLGAFVEKVETKGGVVRSGSAEDTSPVK